MNEPISNTEDSISDSDVQKLRKINLDLLKFKGDFYLLLVELNDKIRAGSNIKYSVGERVDVGYYCREIEKLLDDIRKDVKVTKEMYGKWLAYDAISKGVNNPDTNESLTMRGQDAMATPKMRPYLQTPKIKHKEEYKAFMDFYGVPQKCQDLGFLDIHYTRFGEFAERCFEEGTPVPASCRTSSIEYSCTFRKKGRG